MRNLTLLVASLGLVAASSLQPTPAAADANNNAYVDARSGSNSNAGAGCPVTAPCADLNTALSVIAVNGSVIILVGGAFGPIYLNGSVNISGTSVPSQTSITAVAGQQVGCIGGLPGAGACAGLPNNGYAVEIAAQPTDNVKMSYLAMSAGGTGVGALKVTSGGTIYQVHNIYRGNGGAGTTPIITIAPGLANTTTQVYMSNGDAAFSKNGGAVLVAPTGTNSAKLHFNHMEVHNAAFGIKTDATGLTFGAANSVSTFVSESEFFSFTGSAVTALTAVSGGTGGAVNSVYNQVNILNAGGPAINANGAQTFVILTASTAAGNFQGIKLSNGATVLSSVNNTLQGNGANNCCNVVGTLTQAPLQ